MDHVPDINFINEQLEKKEAEARNLQQWLTDHAAASIDARIEMQRRLKIVLQDMNELIFSKYPFTPYPCR
jgi:hypothetical protein